jgi:Ser/Thr protein kinase RdoA (MazF antagonist)
VNSDQRLTHAKKVRQMRERKLAGAALEQYGLRDARVGFLRQRNWKTLFRVASPTQGEFTLHMYRRPNLGEDALRSPDGLRSFDGRSSEAALHSQLLWMAALRRETDLSVPEAIPTLDGSLTSYVSVEDVPAPRRCTLLRWMPGKSMLESLRPANLSLVGSYVARLHLHAERFSVPEGFLRPRWDWDHVLGNSALLWSRGEVFYSESEMEVFRAAAERVKWTLHAVGENSSVFGIIHSDLLPQNFVFHTGTVCAIDFDECGWGYYLFDLAWMFRALGFSAPMQAALLEGYQRERPLPEDYQKHFETCMAMRVVDLVNRILGWKTPTRQPWGPSFLSDAVKELAGFLENDSSRKAGE